MKKKGIREQSNSQRLHPQIKQRFYILTGVTVFIFFASVTLTLAHTFTDSLANGLDSEFWTITQSTQGLYSFDDTQGNFALAKTAMQSPGGMQNINVNLNLAKLGGNISGDFSTQVSFSNAVLPDTTGYNWNQFHFALYFQDGSFTILRRTTNPNVIDVYSSIEGYVESIDSTATSGTFTFSRSGSTISSYFNGVLRNTENNNAALTYIGFNLQNHNTNDIISVVCNNFSLTADSVTTVVYADSDNDGVIDNWDNCPGTPEGSCVDKHGCHVTGLYTEEQMNQMVSAILTWGDINGDKKIDLSEAIHALRVTSGVTEPAMK